MRKPLHVSLIVFASICYYIISKFAPTSPQQLSFSSVCMETGTPESRSRPIKEEKDICLLYEPPSPYLDLMTKALVGSPRAGRCSVGRKSKACLPPHDPYNSFLRRFGDDWPPYGYTMIGIERLQSFMSAINEVNRNHVLGAIMEFGVWRGGAMIMAAAMQKERGTNRDLYLFDAFGPVGGNSYGKDHDFLSVDVDTVRSSFEYFDVWDASRINLVKGLFRDSVLDWVNRSDPVAVLRIDGNFYDSYQDVLYALYENVQVGGIIIFDDVYSHSGVMDCWRDFKVDHGLSEHLVRIDRHSAWFRKKKHIRVAMTKKHLPVDVNK